METTIITRGWLATPRTPAAAACAANPQHACAPSFAVAAERHLLARRPEAG